MRRLLQILSIVATVGLPFLLYAAYRLDLEARSVWGVLISFYMMRWSVSHWEKFRSLKLSSLRPTGKSLLMVVGTAVGILLISKHRGDHYLYIPTMINGVLLFNFSVTLVKGPPIVETFARKMVTCLSDDELHYCRTVTVIWSLFFIANGGFAFYLAWQGMVEFWTLYTGVIAYMLMGTLFFFEMTYRYWRFRNYGTTPVDNLYKRIFPVLSDEK